MYNIKIISQLPLHFDSEILSFRYKVYMMIQTFGIFEKRGETIKIVLRSRCDIRKCSYDNINRNQFFLFSISATQEKNGAKGNLSLSLQSVAF